MDSLLLVAAKARIFMILYNFLRFDLYSVGVWFSAFPRAAPMGQVVPVAGIEPMRPALKSLIASLSSPGVFMTNGP